MKAIDLFVISAICVLFAACESNNDSAVEYQQMPSISTDLTGCAQCQSEDPKNLKVAVLVEPRQLDLAIPVIESAFAALPADWIVQVFHGLNNEAFFRKHFANEIRTGRMVLSKINIRNINLSYYNNTLFLNSYFWENIIGETVLNFETDSIFCNNGTNIDDFLTYDFIGAPWTRSSKLGQDFVCHVYESKDRPGVRIINGSRGVTTQSLQAEGFSNIQYYQPILANGGFMLRKRSKVLETLHRYVSTTAHHVNRLNDVFYGCAFLDQALSGADINLPDMSVAKRFSVEAVFYEQPFGVHKPWLYLKRHELDKLGEQCSGLSSYLKPYYENKDGWGK